MNFNHWLFKITLITILLLHLSFANEEIEQPIETTITTETTTTTIETTTTTIETTNTKPTNPGDLQMKLLLRLPTEITCVPHEARSYSDPGYFVRYNYEDISQSNPVDVAYTLPDSVRKGIPGTYEIEYVAIDKTNNLRDTAVRKITILDIKYCSEEKYQHMIKCHKEAVCVDVAGDYICVCREGFRDEGYDEQGRICVDVNECTEKTHKCHMHAVCTNTYGGYNCTCKPGFEGDGYVCDDIDECTTDDPEYKHDCPANAQCLNLIGSFECQCPSDFTLSTDSVTGKKICVRPDMCQFRENLCDKKNSKCFSLEDQSNPFGYICKCLDGFYQTDRCVDDKCILKLCDDVNECVSNEYRNHTCPDHSICRNTYGSYDCDCESGYRKSPNGICNDIDECTEYETYPCDRSKHQICINLPGTYKCECEKGYVNIKDSCIHTGPASYLLNRLDQTKDSLDNIRPLEINRFDNYIEPGVTLTDNRQFLFDVKTDIPQPLLQEFVTTCDSQTVSYNVTGSYHIDGDRHFIESKKVSRKVNIKYVSECELFSTQYDDRRDSLQRFLPNCPQHSKCVDNPKGCSYTCVCDAGYEGSYEVGGGSSIPKYCKSIYQPKIQTHLPNPYNITRCIVCDFVSELKEDPTSKELLQVTANEVRPDGSKKDLTHRMEFSYTSESTVDDKTKKYIHHFTVVDDEENEAHYDHTVFVVEQDLRKLIIYMEEKLRQEEAARIRDVSKISTTLGLSYLRLVVLALTLVLIGYFIFLNFTQVSLIVRILFGHDATWEEYNLAMTFWYGLIHPFMTPQQRSVMIYSEYFNKED